LRKLISVLLLFGCLSAPVRALEVSAQSAVVFDPLTGAVLWSKDPRRPMPMASTTKIMTALVSLERYDPDRIVTVQKRWIGVEGSSMYLREGETVTVRDLLCGLLLMSGNDASETLAGLWTGDRDDFIALMNRRAAELGMIDTVFENPSGLDEGDHHSTAEDMARLTASAMAEPLFREIVSSAAVTAAGRSMRNHNRLLTLCEGASGVKTGYTKKAGRCLVSAAERQGRQLIAVTLNAPDDWNDHIALYDEMFGELTDRQTIPGGIVGEVPVVSGTSRVCRLYTEGASSLLFPGDPVHAELTLRGPRMVYAPVRAGAQYGTITASLGGKVLCEADVFYQTDIPEHPERPGLLARLYDTLFRK